MQIVTVIVFINQCNAEKSSSVSNLVNETTGKKCFQNDIQTHLAHAAHTQKYITFEDKYDTNVTDSSAAHTL